MINVLIVEDDPMVAQLNCKYLMMLTGFNLVGIANNGQMAIDFLRKGSVDLVLLDVFMPQLNGAELLKIIRTTYVDVDIIMVTAAKSTSDIQAALRLGVIDYLVKPFEFDRFQIALLSYKERRRLLFSDEEVEQSQLDKGIFFKNYKYGQEAVPKGIDINTLTIINDAIRQHKNDFTINDMANLTGLSRISLKKYFDYMEQCGELSSSLYYPAIGRPSRLYKVLLR